MAKVASPETLDKVVNNALAVQLGDEDLAREVYADVRAQVMTAAERWHDVDVAIELAPWPDGPQSGDGAMFVATIRWEYRVTPSTRVLRLACVSDLAEYRELLHDPTSTLVWYFEPVHGLDASSLGVFDLVGFSVDGTAITPRNTRRANSQNYVVDLANALDREPGEPTRTREVVLSYTYRVLVQRHSHMLQVDLAKPSRGVKVSFRYAGCGIRFVNVLDFFARTTPPRISRSQPPHTAVEVAIDGWIWPKSGVAFGWVLEDELLAPTRRKRRLPSD